MKWYLAKITYQIICGDGCHTPQFDEQIRLIAAINTQEAFNKARSIGVKEQETFYNYKEQPVEWRFINVSEIYPFNLINGSEIFSRITEQEQAQSYINLIHLKAEELQRGTSTIQNGYLIVEDVPLSDTSCTL